MADVFLARYESGEYVALKRLRPELAADHNLLGQLESEARLCGLLAHECIVGFKGMGADDEGPYLALEYVEGLSASALVRRWTASQHTYLPLEAVLSLIADLADGLAYAHAFRGEGVNGVIHRDVSPDNVLVASSGGAKLADFGIAKVLGTTNVTRTGSVKGKLGYLAPELFEGASASPASDVFSLGATAFRLLTGVTPFQGDNEAQLVRAVLHNEAPKVASLRTDVPDAVADWVDRSLSKTPQARPALWELSSQLSEVRKPGRIRLAGCVHTVVATMPAAQDALVSDRQTQLAQPVRSRKAWPKWSAAVIAAGLVAGLVMWKFAAGSPSVGPVALVEQPAKPKPEPAPKPELAPSPPPLAAVKPQPETEPKLGPPQDAVARVEPKTKPAQRPRPARLTNTKAAPVKPPPQAAPRTGTLRIKVRPWGNVFVDGTPRGTAPLAPLELPAGKHSVIVANPQLNKSRTHEVNVIAGQETELKVVLDDGN